MQCNKCSTRPAEPGMLTCKPCAMLAVRIMEAYLAMKELGAPLWPSVTQVRYLGMYQFNIGLN